MLNKLENDAFLNFLVYLNLCTGTIFKNLVVSNSRNAQIYKTSWTSSTYVGTMQLQCASFCAPFHDSNKQPEPCKMEAAKKNLPSI